MKDHSTHLTRDKKSDDHLEAILEPWGVWRQWGVEGLSSGRKSPIVGVNQPEKRRTDKLDLERYAKIRESLLPHYSGAELRHQTYRAWREWKARIRGMVSRETKLMLVTDPKYGGHKHYSKIDQLLSTIHGPYYNILIRKYEDLWSINDFCIQNGWETDYTSDRIYKARRAARKILKKNGYKA